MLVIKEAPVSSIVAKTSVLSLNICWPTSLPSASVVYVMSAEDFMFLVTTSVLALITGANI